MNVEPLDLHAPPSIEPLVEEAMMLCDSIEEKSMVGLVGHHSLTIQDLRRILLRNVKENTPEYGVIETTNRLGLTVYLRVRGETWQALRHVLRNHPLKAFPDAPVYLRHKIDARTRKALERGEYVDPERLSRNNSPFYDVFRRLGERALHKGDGFAWPWARRKNGSPDVLFGLFRAAWKDGPLTYRRRLPKAGP